MSQAFTHRVLPYDGMDEFLAGSVPFLRAGIESGDRVLAVTGLGSELMLREVLGPLGDGVEFFESSDWYAHPARTLADCLSDADALCGRGRRLRILGEPAWTARPDLEVLEWQRVEAIVNVAFAETGASILCPYAKTLPPGVVAAARRTHPETVRGTTVVPNPSYMNPWTYSAQCDRTPLSPVPDHAEELPIERPDLFWLRAWVSDYAKRTPLPDEELQRLLVAVTEVVTNAIRHGAPPIVLRMWMEPAELVCEVVDHGEWETDTGFGLLPPPPDGPARFGLWAVRLLCAIVQIRTGGGRTAVRLRLRLPSVPTSVPVRTIEGGA